MERKPLAGKGLGLQLHSMEVSSADKTRGTQEAPKPTAAVRRDVDSIGGSKTVELAAENRLPSIHNQADA
jgi:hypothetical protein